MRILNFGSLNLDNVYQLKHFVQPGETITAENYAVHLGGKGHNQSVAIAKAGISVWHAGMIGSEGEALRWNLQKWGVNTDFLHTSENPTGHSVIQVDSAGQNAIVVCQGANGAITERFAGEVLAHFGDGDYLILQNEISAISEIMELAHEQGMHIILNPSPFNEKIDAYPLKYVNMFVVNEIEGGALTGQTQPDAICDSIRRQYPDAAVLLTLGSDGSVFCSDKGFIRQPAYPAVVVDTTAAGDTFLGYFLAWLVTGESVEEALRAASIASAIAISRPGAATSIPEKQEVIAELEKMLKTYL
jgi:ribokinase